MNAFTTKNPDILEFMMTNIKYHIHDINLPDKNDEIPLHLAIRLKKSRKCICDLIALTGIINQKNCDGDTPLHELCMRILLDSMHEEHDLVFDNMTLYDYYDDDDYYYGYFHSFDNDSLCSECQNLCDSFDNEFTDELMSTKHKEDALYVLQELLKVETINVSIQNSLGKPPLYYLTDTRSLCEGLKLMLNHKTFKANIQDQEGLTLLHILCQSYYNHSAVELLLSSSTTGLQPPILIP